MMDLTQVQFLVKGPYRHSDGSFKFDVLLILPSLAGGVSQIVGTGNIHVDNDKACAAMGRALIQIGEQLPPDIARPS